MSLVFLVGVGHEHAAAFLDALPPAVTLTAHADAAAAAGALPTVQSPVDLIVVGPEQPGDLAAAAHRLDQLARGAPLLVLCPAPQQQAVQRKILFTPFHSQNVQVMAATARREALVQVFTESVQRAQQQRRYSGLLQQVQPRLPGAAAGSARTNRLYLNALLSYAPVGLVLVDAALCVQEWNRQAGLLFGEEQQQAVGRALASFFAEEDRPRVTETLEKGLAGEQTPVTAPLRQGARLRYLDVAAAPVADQGRYSGAIVILQESTGRVEAEAEARRLAEQAAVSEALARQAAHLQQLNVQLEQRNRELQEFAYVASHDLQEPLRKISTFADLLVSDHGGDLHPTGRLYIDRIQDAAARMSHLIRDVLAYSRVQTRGRAFAPVDLNAVLQGVLGDLSVAIDESEAMVSSGPLPVLRADATQMHQLLLNLIGNALKFRSPERPPRIRVAAREGRSAAGAVALLDVEDNGVGFDPRYVDRIFNPFQRLHDRSAYAGTGIGLAICRGIAERHGGLIHAHSRPGEGSVFTVELPLDPPA